MRSTGITRKMDNLGRLVIPSGLRNELNLKENEQYEFFVKDDDGEIYLCIKCENADPAIEHAKRILQQAGIKI